MTIPSLAHSLAGWLAGPTLRNYMAFLFSALPKLGPNWDPHDRPTRCPADFAISCIPRPDEENWAPRARFLCFPPSLPFSHSLTHSLSFFLSFSMFPHLSRPRRRQMKRRSKRLARLMKSNARSCYDYSLTYIALVVYNVILSTAAVNIG